MTTAATADAALLSLAEQLLAALTRSGGRLSAQQLDTLDNQLQTWIQQEQSSGLSASTAQGLEAALAVQRVRTLLAQGDLAGARLLLAGLATQPALPALLVPCLRLAAVLARRLGRADEAATLLANAAAHAAQSGDAALLVLVRSEQIVALAEDEQWTEALAVARLPLAAALQDAPEALAARSEAVAVLAAHGGDMAAALQACAQALALREALADRVGWLRAAALRLQWLDDPELAAAASAAAADVGRGDLLFRLQLGRARRQLAAGALTLPDATRLAELAAADASPAEQLAALDLHCVAALAAGDLQAAAASGEQALRLAEALAAPRWQRRCQVRQAQVLALQGDAEAALHQAAAVADAAQAAADAQVVVRAWLVAGPLLHRLGRLQEAIELLREAVRTASEQPLPVLAAEAAVELGRAQLGAQQWSDAQVAFDLARQLAEAHGLVGLALDAARGTVLALRSRGEPDEAAQHAARALAAAEGQAAARHTAGLCVELAQLALDAGQPQSAERWLQRIEADSHPSVQGEAAILLARVRLSTHGPEAAVTPLLHAVGLLRTHGPVRSLGAALFLLGQVYGLLGEHAAAGRWLGEALILTTQHHLPEQHLVAEVLRRAQRASAAEPPPAQA